MPDAVQFIKTIKRTAVEAVQAQKPAEICFGKVLSVSPLRINIEQKLSLDEKQLVLTKNVSDFTAEYVHPEAGIQTVAVRNGLASGDSVVLVRQQGGQKYIVLDRIL